MVRETCFPGEISDAIVDEFARLVGERPMRHNDMVGNVREMWKCYCEAARDIMHKFLHRAGLLPFMSESMVQEILQSQPRVYVPNQGDAIRRQRQQP